ncbi:hypothetical protein ACLBXM_16985 [Xanthobacteraceae bacterium A53D]
MTISAALLFITIALWGMAALVFAASHRPVPVRCPVRRRGQGGS